MTTKTPIEQAREIRAQYRATAESITYRSGEHGTAGGREWTAAPGYGASIYRKSAGVYVVTIGETWKPSRFDGWVLINTTRRKFATREAARIWAHEQATAAGYPEQDARPAYNLFTV